MSRNYSGQPDLSKLSAVALTSSYGDARSFTIETGGMTDLVLYISYTMGATETSNSIEVKVESGQTATDLHRLTTLSTSGGTVTLTAVEYTFVGTNAAEAKFALPLMVADKYVKFSFKETGVATNAGTVTAKITTSGE